MENIPINDTVIYALARLVDDAQKERRYPSHSDIEFQINKADLTCADPNKKGSPVGKAKRVRAVLMWGIENRQESAEFFAASVISSVRACGGFRNSSPNFVGLDEIRNLSDSLKPLGISLAEDGSLSPISLEGLFGEKLTEALEIYVDRAKKGIDDAALVVGTSKDLIEAVAAHVLQELWGQYPTDANFPMLLGQAFTALDMSTIAEKESPGEHPRKNMERKMFELACTINKLRNKQGTGHGRPWLPDITQDEARAAIEFIGTISEKMLAKLKQKKA
ncbi:MAG: abortive infection family protein [bacterium]